jgi:hypothetical protein
MTTNFIIKQGCSSTEFFSTLHKLYDKARELSIEDYITGKVPISSEEEIKSIDRPLIHFYRVELEKQTLSAEEKLRNRISKRLELNPLTAYELVLPVPAANPQYPTQAELDDARLFIPYHKSGYTASLKLRGEREAPVNQPQLRQAQYDEIRPDQRYFGYGSLEAEDVNMAALVQPINLVRYEDLIEMEVARHPSIQRLNPDDNAEAICTKLTQTNIDKAVAAFNKGQDSYTKAYDRNSNLHGTILKFFRESIENVESSTAATFLASRQWDKVITSVIDSYGNAKAPANLDEMHNILGSMELEPLETVHTFLQRMKEQVVNIQMISEKSEEILNPISHEKMLEASFYTENEWSQKYPTRRRVIGHLEIVNRTLAAISKSRLKQVHWDFNTQMKTPQHRTIATLIDMMITGESSLGTNAQVLHAISNVTAVQKSGTGTSFCAYHSHGNQVATHNTSECKSIKGGFAIHDPEGSSWYVTKKDGAFYKGKSNSGGDDKAKKRKNDTESDSKDKKRTAKECATCLKNNKDGSTIPEYVYKSHYAADCRVDPKKYKGDKDSKNKGPSKIFETPFWKDSIKQLTKSISTAIAPTRKTKESKSKGGNKKSTRRDNDDDDDDDSEA